MTLGPLVCIGSWAASLPMPVKTYVSWKRIFFALARWLALSRSAQSSGCSSRFMVAFSMQVIFCRTLQKVRVSYFDGLDWNMFGIHISSGHRPGAVHQAFCERHARLKRIKTDCRYILWDYIKLGPYRSLQNCLVLGL